MVGARPAAASRILPAAPDAAAPLAQLAAGQLEAGLPRRLWTPARLQAHLRDPAVVALRALQGRRVVGYGVIRCDGATAFLDLIVVEPDARRLGIGRALFEALRAHVATLGAIAIDLDVRASNVAAQRFYAALGFQVAGRRPRHYCGVEDAVRLRRAA